LSCPALAVRSSLPPRGRSRLRTAGIYGWVGWLRGARNARASATRSRFRSDRVTEARPTRANVTRSARNAHCVTLARATAARPAPHRCAAFRCSCFPRQRRKTGQTRGSKARQCATRADSRGSAHPNSYPRRISRPTADISSAVFSSRSAAESAPITQWCAWSSSSPKATLSSAAWAALIWVSTSMQ
jgi:hypothetical protein